MPQRWFLVVVTNKWWDFARSCGPSHSVNSRWEHLTSTSHKIAFLTARLISFLFLENDCQEPSKTKHQMFLQILLLCGERNKGWIYFFCLRKCEEKHMIQTWFRKKKKKKKRSGRLSQGSLHNLSHFQVLFKTNQLRHTNMFSVCFWVSGMQWEIGSWKLFGSWDTSFTDFLLPSFWLSITIKKKS